MMPRKPTGNMTPERQRLRDRANMLCDQRAASSVWASRIASSRMCVFPRHPAATGRKFCGGCRRWLTSRFWTLAKGEGDGKFWAADDGWLRCDHCMRDAWRRANERSRAKPRAVAVNNVPKGWGF